MRLEKTSGIIESFLLSFLLTFPVFLFFKHDWMTLFYIFSCFFILIGLMCNLFMSEPKYTSMIKNVITTSYERAKNENRKK
jgi:hypothetical protein